MKCFPLFACLTLGACGAPQKQPVPVLAPDQAEEPIADDAHDFRTAVSRGVKYTIQWRPARGSEVPKNEHFELEVRLYRNVDDDLVPVPGARLAVSGWMPDHGHGMVRQPQATDQGDGSYLVRGMLFHMGGHWQLFFDVIEDGLSERTDFELDL
jgi:hypothetical protein